MPVGRISCSDCKAHAVRTADRSRRSRCSAGRPAGRCSCGSMRGPPAGSQLLLAQRLGEGLADQVGNDLLLDLRPVMLAHDVDRRLARTKALDARGAAHLQQACVHLLVERGSPAPTPACAVPGPISVSTETIICPSTSWCERRDSNSQGFPHRNLNPARLPIPPLSHLEPALDRYPALHFQPLSIAYGSAAGPRRRRGPMRCAGGDQARQDEGRQHDELVWTRPRNDAGISRRGRMKRDRERRRQHRAESSAQRARTRAASGRRRRPGPPASDRWDRGSGGRGMVSRRRSARGPGMVGHVGLEPTTYGLRVRSSTN